MSCFVITLPKGNVIVAFADDRMTAIKAVGRNGDGLYMYTSIVQADVAVVVDNTPAALNVNEVKYSTE